MPADQLTERIRALSVGRTKPLVVGLDGRSGAGKSTLAPLVAAEVGGVVVDGDDFYAGGSGDLWDAMTAEQKVVLEGVYSARPELADLVDLKALLLVPDDIRRAQLLAREGEAYRRDWEARWAEAELWYFASVMPPEAFDVVLG